MFNFQVVSETTLESGEVALVLAVTNLPEGEAYQATPEYNKSHRLPEANEYRFTDVDMDLAKLDEDAENFLRTYGTQLGIPEPFTVSLSEDGWSNTGFDTPADLGVKIEAWITPIRQAQGSRYLSQSRTYSNLGGLTRLL